MAVIQWQLCVSKWTRGEEPLCINIRQQPALQLFLCFQPNHQEAANTCSLSWSLLTTPLDCFHHLFIHATRLTRATERQAVHTASLGGVVMMGRRVMRGKLRENLVLMGSPHCFYLDFSVKFFLLQFWPCLLSGTTDLEYSKACVLCLGDWILHLICTDTACWRKDSVVHLTDRDVGLVDLLLACQPLLVFILVTLFLGDSQMANSCFLTLD